MKGGFKKMPPRRSSFSRRNQRSNPLANLFGEGSRGLFSLFGGQQTKNRNIFFGNSSSSQGGFDGITGMISNTQKAIESVKKVTPVVQQVRQYGPLIRNLPSMYKMIKAINSSTDDTEDDVEEEKEETKKSENVGSSKKSSHDSEKDLKVDFIQTKNTKIEEKKSVPKFFTPGTRT